MSYRTPPPRTRVAAASLDDVKSFFRDYYAPSNATLTIVTIIVVTGLVGRMEDNGLIQRRPCEQDGRSTRLYLTAKGRAAVAQAQPVLARVNAQLTKGFTQDELAVVARFLHHAASITFTTESVK